MDDLTTRQLRRELRESADAHRPDRERILARVQQGMSPPAGAPRRRPRGYGRLRLAGTGPWLRVAGASAAVAGILAVGGYAVTSVAQDDDGRGQTAVVPPVSPGPADYLQGEGSIDPESNPYWAQSEVAVRSEQRLSSLTVELRVAQTGGLDPTGSWSTRPAEDFTVSVREEGGVFVYRWTLKSGRTVPAGRHTFAGQYNHAEGGREAEGDTYTATGRAAGGEAATVSGGFAPATSQ
ncbi:hypothetical protein ACIHCQ_15700 [Streptomyces sp. NPDC052236]|uniref:hypothetical protein n=1 Tax=Streptomyces sp. NPDC052236 TaxID=3365686 RepID=UPI0037D80CAB